MQQNDRTLTIMMETIESSHHVPEAVEEWFLSGLGKKLLSELAVAVGESLDREQLAKEFLHRRAQEAAKSAVPVRVLSLRANIGRTGVDVFWEVVGDSRLSGNSIIPLLQEYNRRQTWDEMQRNGGQG